MYCNLQLLSSMAGANGSSDNSYALSVPTPQEALSASTARGSKNSKANFLTTKNAKANVYSLECSRPGTCHGMFQTWTIPRNVPGLTRSMEGSRPGTFHEIFQAFNIPWNVPTLEHSMECSRPGTLHGMFLAWNIPWNVPGLEHSMECYGLGH